VEPQPPWEHAPSNPMQVRIRRGRMQWHLVVYAWRITLEGKGRTKAGRDDLDYRVQGTRAGTEPVLLLPGAVTVGIGWDAERDLFLAFDMYMKRNPGASSSVHITRALLDTASHQGATVEDDRHGPQLAFSPGAVDDLFGWLSDLSRRRIVVLEPVELHLRDPEHAVIVGDALDNQSTRLRKGDHVVVASRRRLLDRNVWTVAEIETLSRLTPQGRNRYHLRFHCVRHGVITDPQWLQGE